MLVSESIDHFKRGQEPKTSLDLGYINSMPEELDEIYQEVEMTNQVIQPIDKSLLNHPSRIGQHRGHEGPLFNIRFGGEAGAGLSEDSDAFFSIDVFIDPFMPGVSGEISGNDENGDDFEIVESEFEPINGTDIKTIAKAVNRKALDLIDKSPIELEIY